MKKKVLFITPTLARTGSEMILWYLLNNINRDKFEPYVFCLGKGELFNQLHPDIQKFRAYNSSGKIYKKIFRAILKVFGVEPISFQLKLLQKKIKADLWLVNTSVIYQPHIAAHTLAVPIATFVHENLYGFTLTKTNEFEKILNYSNYFIGCSTNVCNDLSRVIDTKKIHLQNCFINPAQIHTNPHNTVHLKKKLQIPEDNFVWVLSGTLHYMKGIEYLIQLIQHFKEQKVTFIWIGKSTDDGLTHYLNQVAKNNNRQLILCGQQDQEYYDYLSLGHGFLMLSKTESFSLVLLEAAYLGLPIVSFDVGIAKALIKEDMGRVVENYNLEQLIEAMKFYQNGEKYNKESLRKAIEPYTVKAAIPSFENILEKLF